MPSESQQDNHFQQKRNLLNSMALLSDAYERQSEIKEPEFLDEEHSQADANAVNRNGDITAEWAGAETCINSIFATTATSKSWKV